MNATKKQKKALSWAGKVDNMLGDGNPLSAKIRGEVRGVDKRKRKQAAAIRAQAKEQA